MKKKMQIVNKIDDLFKNIDEYPNKMALQVPKFAF